MAGFTKRRAFRLLLTAFRWCRICVWLAILAVLSAVLYLHLSGLPEFVKTPLLRELSHRGIDAQFSGMRLGWSQEILIEDVSFGRANQKLSPSLSVGSAEVRLDLFALLHRQLKLSSFRIFNGKFRVPLSENQEDSISLDNVQFAFRFLPGDCVELENARGNIRDISIHLEGVLTNFSAIRDWKYSPPSAPDQRTSHQNWQTTLRQIVTVAEQIKFVSHPQLTGTISGDARDPDTLRAEITVAAPGAITPWGEMTNFKLKANCSRIVNPGEAPFALLRMSADSIATTWGGGSQIDLNMTLYRTEADMNVLRGAVDLSAAKLNAASPQFGTNWARVAALKWTGAMTFAVTNFTVFNAEGNLHTRQFESSWGSIRQADVAFQSSTNSQPSQAEASWGLWAAAEPRTLSWQIQAQGIQTPDIDLQNANCSGRWRAPELVVETLESQLYNGCLKASARLDVGTRKASAKVFSNFDPKGFASLLTPVARHWVNDFAYSKPPILEGEVQLTMPAWTNREPDWRGESLPSLFISGKFATEQIGFRGIQVNSAESVFTYSNRTWNLSRLHAVRPDGDVYFDLAENDETHQFRVSIDSQLDPKELLSLLVDLPEADEWLEAVQMAHPPKIHAEACGDYRSLDKTTGTATIEATNLVVLGQPIGYLNTALSYSNLVLKASDVQIVQGDQHFEAPEIQFDFAKDRMYVTNVYSSFNPRRIFSSIASILPEFLLVIGFDVPPTVRVNGYFSISDVQDVDLHFQISGEQFRWTNLTVDAVSGNVDWVGPDVWLTNVVGTLYGGGKGDGWAWFNCRPTNTVEISFETAVRGVDLNLLARGLSGKPMELEGKLGANVSVHGNSSSRKSWQGHGAASVRDGLIWDIPMFGAIISPLINVVSEGAANNRAREAAGTFIVTNGMLYTEDLKIHASWIQLLYRGTVDEKRIDAKVEAQVLRNMPFVGKALSMVFTPLTKALKYRIVGPVNDPIIKPEYVSGMLLDIPFHPLRTLKTMLPSNFGQTPAPVVPSEEKK